MYAKVLTANEQCLLESFSCLLVTLASSIRHCNFPCAIETSPVFYSTSLYLNFL